MYKVIACKCIELFFYMTKIRTFPKEINEIGTCKLKCVKRVKKEFTFLMQAVQIINTCKKICVLFVYILICFEEPLC